MRVGSLPAEQGIPEEGGGGGEGTLTHLNGEMEDGKRLGKWMGAFASKANKTQKEANKLTSTSSLESIDNRPARTGKTTDTASIMRTNHITNMNYNRLNSTDLLQL